MDEGAKADAEHLRILGNFDFVVAGLAFLFAMFPVFHLIIGIAMISGGLESRDDPGLACMFMPFGTALGVFTIITLVKEPVKRLFAAGAGSVT